MTDRVVKVVLRGEVADLLGKLQATKSAVGSTASALTDGSRESEKYRKNLSALGTTAGSIGLVAAAGVGLAIKAYADFDQAISHVAATGDDAARNIDALREAAIDAGADTVYSATEAANAIEELAKAGLTADDILGGGLKGSLDLAASGGLEVADAAQIAAIAMKQFNLDGSEVPHVADLLAAGAGRAVGDVSDLGIALQQSGLVAKQSGLSIEETTAALSAFAAAGLLGSDSGTSFKTLLQSLTPTSAQAAKAIDEYNLSAYDQQGNFIGLEKYAGKLKAGLSGLSEEQRNATLKTIFGSDAVRAASVLYSEGAEGIHDWKVATDDSGYAAEQAAKRVDNLKGDIEKLGGSLQSDLIESGGAANGILRETVQLLTLAANGYGELPSPVKNGTLGVLALTAALGGGVFAITKSLDAYTTLKGNVTGLNVELDRNKAKTLAARGAALGLSVGLSAVSQSAHGVDEDLGDLTDVAASAAAGFAFAGPWGAAIGTVAGLFSALSSGSQQAKSRLDDLTATLDQQTGAITKNTAASVAKSLQESGSVDALRQVGVSLQTATDAALGNADALEQVRSALDVLRRQEGSGQQLQNPNYSDQRGALENILAINSGLKERREVTKKSNDTGRDSAAVQDQITKSGKGLQNQTEDTTDSINDLKDALDGLLDPLLDQDEASNAWRDSIASLSKALRENGTSLDESSQKGRDNRDAIRDRVRALKASVEADAAAGVGQDELVDKLKRGRRSILDAGEAAGVSRSAMRKYIDTLGLTPEQIRTLIKVDGVPSAKQAVRDLRGALAALDGSNWVANVFANIITKKPKATGGAIEEHLRATGGSVIGPGTGTSDSIPAIGPGASQYMLSNGEHILTASDVNKMGGQAGVYAFRQALQNGRRLMAQGGSVNVAAPNVNVAGGMTRDEFGSELRRVLQSGSLRIIGEPGNQRLAMLGG